MADSYHLHLLQEGLDIWNKWREDDPFVIPDLRGIDLARDLNHISLSNANFSMTDLSHANLNRADLGEANFRSAILRQTSFRAANLFNADLYSADLRAANLSRADLWLADLNLANLMEANLSRANLTEVNFRLANLSGAKITDADMRSTNLSNANLSRANLRGTWLEGAQLVEANFTEVDISDCRIFGISAWRLKTEKLKQSNLVITPRGEPEITVDNLEIAQFVYLLLNNKNLRGVIDTLTTKSVLILGRFEGRKVILDGIRGALRQHDYVPMLFDFDKPANRDLTETVMTLASLSRFVIADLSDPNSIPHELMSFVDKLFSVPVQGIFCPTDAHPNPYPMYEHLQRLPHVLPIYRYETADGLLASLEEKVIHPAEEKVKQVRPSI